MRRWANATRLAWLGLVFLAACGGLAGKGQEDDTAGMLRALKEAKQKGEVGSVEGYLFLVMPGVATPLKNWPVKLIPLSPGLEAAVASAASRYIRGGRAPLPAEAVAQALKPINNALEQVAALGYSELINSVKTESQEPRFTFQAVPRGRWLLVAEMPSKISVLHWALPIVVTSGEVTRQSLNDDHVWLEGLKP